MKNINNMLSSIKNEDIKEIIIKIDKSLDLYMKYGDELPNILVENVDSEIIKEVNKTIVDYLKEVREIDIAREPRIMRSEKKAKYNYRTADEVDNHIFEYKKDDNMIYIFVLDTSIVDTPNKVVKRLYDNSFINISLKIKTKKEAIKSFIKKCLINYIPLQLTDNDYSELVDIITEKVTINSFASICYKIAINYLVNYDAKAIDRKFIDELIKDNNIELKNNDDNLDNFVGLDNVKNEISTFKKYVEYCRKNDIDISKTYKSLLFVGEPGTGKTSVARRMASIYYKYGLIKKDKIIEITPDSLVDKYVGWTGDKVKRLLSEIDHGSGILFIDEANLLGRNDNLFYREALTEILKFIENPENVIIFAVYPSKKDLFYNADPGLKSRIFKEIEFKNYNEKELLSILKINLNKYKLKTNKESENLLLNHFKEIKEDSGFGNARYCEQLSQILIFNHVSLSNNSQIISSKEIPQLNIKSQMGFKIKGVKNG